jgi:hypothetical protein
VGSIKTRRPFTTNYILILTKYNLKGLKNIQEGDHMKFISLVETVETCWLDLKRMKLESEMNTATMISQIEKLLPPLQKREWALRKQRFELKTRPGFHDFFTILT